MKVDPVLAEVRDRLIAIPNETQHRANVGAGAERRICLTDRAEAAGRRPAGASDPSCGIYYLAHKRTIPLKAGPVSFKCLLGGTESHGSETHLEVFLSRPPNLSYQGLRGVQQASKWVAGRQTGQADIDLPR